MSQEERGYAVHSLRHGCEKLSGCSVLKFYSHSLSDARVAFDEEVDRCRELKLDYLVVHLTHCRDIVHFGTFDGQILNKWEAYVEDRMFAALAHSEKHGVVLFDAIKHTSPVV